jgi:hypothetical protein
MPVELRSNSRVGSLIPPHASSILTLRGRVPRPGIFGRGGHVTMEVTHNAHVLPSIGHTSEREPESYRDIWTYRMVGNRALAQVVACYWMTDAYDR